MMVFGIVALFTLLFYYVRPLKLADVRVPVATDKASYAPEDEISGIFFGETYYTGSVKVLREVFCKEYKRVMPPPKEAAIGDFYATQSTPRKYEGVTVPVGSLPADIPIGANCVIRFTNVYEVPTPFGARKEEVKYYTQNFSIVGESEREAATEKDAEQQTRQDAENTIQSEGGGNDTQINNQNNIQQPPSEPVEGAHPEQDCTINALGIKLFCD